ncbi:ABC transporter ATP-binding protein [Janthinobacterium psychrotolerans]|uniref:Peptide/nickel transport system ATP-binding protein n=1 Tax=Janthinobacterium psychrotolerans TaxID=1747903 RepID=A0A1A7C088_9BURK|nr:ATP-binding cassette domain-containing protein [Janthinobacterium psychrotolerans]OBV39341.1 peptide/nickel transport system ATP-binding protein [Janthinobacterium psychrotolerans]
MSEFFLDVAGLRVFDAASGKAIVDGVKLRVANGGVLTLLGESGSGKSLLAQAIMGTLVSGLRAEGAIGIGGERFDAADQRSRQRLWGRAVALLPQEPWLALDPTMRVLHQIAETHELVAGKTADQAGAAALRDLDQLGLRHAARLYPHQISGGMAQRVAFLATHAAGAKLLIVDEPTKGLDSGKRDEMLAMLRAAQGDGMAVLCITHDVALARALGGDTAVMLDGCVIEHGASSQLLSRPAHAYTRALLAADPANWPVRSALQAPGEVVAQVDNVAKSFGKHRLFDGITTDIRRGEVVAVTGDSGAGKTTFGNLLLGLLRPDAGTVTRAAGLPRTAFQKLYQDPAAAFAPTLTLRAALRDVLALHGLQWEDMAPLLARLRLAETLLDRLPSQVSGGELQRFALARVLLLKPALIFADEPTSRLDPITQQQTLNLLLEVAGESGCAVLLVTHDAQIARAVGQRRIALHEVG